MKQTIDGVLGKFLCENGNVELIYPDVIPIYWDIETYNTQHHEVPSYNDEFSHISMICVVRLDHVKVWLYDVYKYDISRIS